MDKYGKIAKAIREIAGSERMTQSTIFTAKVEKVENSTCVVKVGDFSISNVRLRAVINDSTDQLFIKPKKDSHVLVADFSGGTFRDLAVISYSEVEAINISIGEDTTIDINKDGIIFNGGEKGLVKVDKMVEWMDNVYNDFTSLKTLLSSFTGTVPGVGEVTASVVFNNQTSKPTESFFENIKIKQ